MSNQQTKWDIFKPKSNEQYFEFFTFMSITPLASFDLSNLITGAEDRITDDLETSTIIRTVGSVVCKF